jgi:hypothetical protein
METENTYFENGQPPNGGGEESVDRMKSDRYYQAVREHESLGAEYNGRFESRKQHADDLRRRHLSVLDARETEYNSDRTRIKQKLHKAKLDLEATHRSASEHCSEIGVRYVPGKTTEVDVLSVPMIEEAEAAKRLGLPFGVGFNDRLLRFFKPILTILCWLMSSLSLGLGFKILDTKKIFGNPTTVGLSLVMGGVVALGLLVAITSMWKALGTKIGAGRPTREVVGLLIPIAAMTAALLLGVAVLDAKAVILLNAARAALNPAFAIPMGIAVLIGAVISGTYILGLAGTGFAESYSLAAKKSIDAEIKGDENGKREAVKQTVLIREALEALADVKVAEQIIQNHENDLMRMDKEFKHERAEMLASVPVVPTTLEPDELRELASLRDRIRSAKAHLDAHIVSRSNSFNTP